MHAHLPPSSSFMNGHQWPANNSLPPISSPLTSLPESECRGNTRKRSYDGESEEPVAKRITRPQTGPVQYGSAIAPLRQDARRLPVPDLTISTSQSMSNGYSAPTTMSQNAPVLPPLGGRAMSTVYAPPHLHRGHQFPCSLQAATLPVDTQLPLVATALILYKSFFHTDPPQSLRIS